MEQIKGFHIKDFQQMETRRGIAFNAKLYLNDKQIGDIENEGNGGITSVCVSKEYLPTFNDRLGAYFNEAEIHAGLHAEFAEELIDLHELAEQFNDLSSKHPDLYALVTVDHRDNYYDVVKEVGHNNVPLLKTFAIRNEKGEEHIKEKFPHATITLYKSKNDFIIE